MVLNHRFAPDRTEAEAEAHVRALLAPLPRGRRHRRGGGRWRRPPRPALDHPLLGPAHRAHGLQVRAKLGWTDVARFAELGVPAANFGPGDATLAHTAGEHLDRAPLERVWAVLDRLLREGPGR